MRLRPICLGLALLLAACQSAPTTPTVASPMPTATPGMVATATPAPQPSASPSPSPSLSPSPSPTPSLSPLPLVSPTPTPSGSPAPLGEANHGSAPFPSAPGSSQENIPVTKATATSGADTAIGAIDGRLYTEWSARQGVSDNVTLVLDLGSTQTFSRIDLLPDATPAVNCFFNVDVSTDGTTWTTVGTGNAAGSNNTPQWGTATFPAQTARYARIKPTSWGGSWVAVWEVRVRK